MVIVAAKHTGGDIIEATCECIGKRGSKGSTRVPSCKVDVNAVIPHSTASPARTLTGELHDAPQKCDFCDEGNGTFPCFVNTASDRVGFSEKGLKSDRKALLTGALLMGAGCLCCVLLVIIVATAKIFFAPTPIPAIVAPSSMGLYVDGGAGYGYVNPTPTPEYGFALQQQQAYTGGAAPFGVTGGAYGMQAAPSTVYGVPIGFESYGGYYGDV